MTSRDFPNEELARRLLGLQHSFKENTPKVLRVLFSLSFQSTTKLIKEAMDFPRKRFIEMVKKYVHFRRVKEIQQNVQRMKMETNVNETVLLSLKEMEERMVKVSQNSNSPYRKRRCSQTLSIFFLQVFLTLLLFKQQKELWEQKKEQFIKARADILEQLYRV